ncbi:alpha/beta fold hydrolase [Asanoa sp. NPDC049573]|uniref:alpha/beta fold hydrolase n=1 Tax=Asanoa sp. NPDC049573 TaxID=3155396 RepID=UPI00342B3CD4
MPDLVILVHGTFATSDDEAGEAWWQRGSQTWEWLAAHLPPDVVLLDDSIRLFTWDGDNSQISRLHAANRLLAFLLELERQGHTYHLVGHSHGGSVIWEALVSAEVTRGEQVVYAELRRALNDPTIRLGDEPLIRERPDEHAPGFVKYKTRHIPRAREYAAVRAEVQLRGLRSWTTVGTPFMRFLPTRRAFVTGWRSRGLCLGEHPGRQGLTDLLLAASVTLPIFYLAVVVVASSTGARWPQVVAHSSVANALALPILLWWLVAIWVTGNRRHAESLLVRERAGLLAAHRFAGRWLGLWSPADEAINALSASVAHPVAYESLHEPVARRVRQPVPALPVPFPLPRLRLPVAVGATHLLPELPTVNPTRLTWPAVAAANRWLEPLWRRAVARALTRAAQGADLPHAVAAYVSPWPLPLAGARARAGLPDASIIRLDRIVAGHNATVGPKARELLLIAALEGPPSEGFTVGPAGLIHTVYFADEGVRELIVRHIRRSRGHPEPDDALSAWLTAYQCAVHGSLTQFTQSSRS